MAGTRKTHPEPPGLIFYKIDGQLHVESYYKRFDVTADKMTPEEWKLGPIKHVTIIDDPTRPIIKVTYHDTFAKAFNQKGPWEVEYQGRYKERDSGERLILSPPGERHPHYTFDVEERAPSAPPRIWTPIPVDDSVTHSVVQTQISQNDVAPGPCHISQVQSCPLASCDTCTADQWYCSCTQDQANSLATCAYTYSDKCACPNEATSWQTCTVTKTERLVLRGTPMLTYEENAFSVLLLGQTSDGNVFERKGTLPADMKPLAGGILDSKLFLLTDKKLIIAPLEEYATQRQELPLAPYLNSESAVPLDGAFYPLKDGHAIIVLSTNEKTFLSLIDVDGTLLDSVQEPSRYTVSFDSSQRVILSAAPDDSCTKEHVTKYFFVENNNLKNRSFDCDQTIHDANQILLFGATDGEPMRVTLSNPITASFEREGKIYVAMGKKIAIIKNFDTYETLSTMVVNNISTDIILLRAIGSDLLLGTSDKLYRAPIPLPVELAVETRTAAPPSTLKPSPSNAKQLSAEIFLNVLSVDDDTKGDSRPPLNSHYPFRAVLWYGKKNKFRFSDIDGGPCAEKTSVIVRAELSLGGTEAVALPVSMRNEESQNCQFILTNAANILPRDGTVGTFRFQVFDKDGNPLSTIAEDPVAYRVDKPPVANHPPASENLKASKIRLQRSFILLQTASDETTLLSKGSGTIEGCFSDCSKIAENDCRLQGGICLEDEKISGVGPGIKPITGSCPSGSSCYVRVPLLDDCGLSGKVCCAYGCEPGLSCCEDGKGGSVCASACTQGTVLSRAQGSLPGAATTQISGNISDKKIIVSTAGGVITGVTVGGKQSKLTPRARAPARTLEVNDVREACIDSVNYDLHLSSNQLKKVKAEWMALIKARSNYLNDENKAPYEAALKKFLKKYITIENGDPSILENEKGKTLLNNFEREMGRYLLKGRLTQTKNIYSGQLELLKKRQQTLENQDRCILELAKAIEKYDKKATYGTSTSWWHRHSVTSWIADAAAAVRDMVAHRVIRNHVMVKNIAACSNYLLHHPVGSIYQTADIESGGSGSSSLKLLRRLKTMIDEDQKLLREADKAQKTLQRKNTPSFSGKLARLGLDKNYVTYTSAIVEDTYATAHSLCSEAWAFDASSFNRYDEELCTNLYRLSATIAFGNAYMLETEPGLSGEYRHYADLIRHDLRAQRWATTAVDLFNPTVLIPVAVVGSGLKLLATAARNSVWAKRTYYVATGLAVALPVYFTGKSAVGCYAQLTSHPANEVEKVMSAGTDVKNCYGPIALDIIFTVAPMRPGITSKAPFITLDDPGFYRRTFRDLFTKLKESGSHESFTSRFRRAKTRVVEETSARSGSETPLPSSVTETESTLAKKSKPFKDLFALRETHPDELQTALEEEVANLINAKLEGTSLREQLVVSKERIRLLATSKARAGGDPEKARQLESRFEEANDILGRVKRALEVRRLNPKDFENYLKSWVNERTTSEGSAAGSGGLAKYDRFIEDAKTKLYSKGSINEDEFFGLLRKTSEKLEEGKITKVNLQRLRKAKDIITYFKNQHPEASTIRVNDVVLIPSSGETIVVGDLHGRADDFIRVLTKTRFIERAAAGEDVRLVLLGDYVHRGGQEFELLNLLMRLKTDPLIGDKIVMLKGNHEGSFGYITNNDFDVRLLSMDYSVHEGVMSFFESLPVAAMSDEAFFAHAAPPIPIGSKVSSGSVARILESRLEILNGGKKGNDYDIGNVATWGDLYDDNGHLLPGQNIKEGDRGRVQFGREALKEFMKEGEFKYFFRGHERVGSSFLRTDLDRSKSVITISGRHTKYDFKDDSTSSSDFEFAILKNGKVSNGFGD